MKFLKHHRLKVAIALIVLAAVALILNIKLRQKYEENPGLIPPAKNYDIEVELTPEKEMEYETNVIEYDKKIKGILESTGLQEMVISGVTIKSETSGKPQEDRFIQKVINLRELGRYTEAIRTINELFKRYNQSFLGRHNMGVLFQEVGEYEKAILNYKKIVEVNGDKGGVYYREISKLYVNLGDGQEAGQRYIKYEQNGGVRDEDLMNHIRKLNRK